MNKQDLWAGIGFITMLLGVGLLFYALTGSLLIALSIVLILIGVLIAAVATDNLGDNRW